MIEIKPTKIKEAGINITPLVDIVFLLLVFFMLTAFFIQPEGIGIKLPEADAEVVEEKDEIIIIIDKYGIISIADEVVSLDRLESEIKSKLIGGSDNTVVIKADRSVMLQSVVSVMDKCKKAGVEKLVIASDPESGGPD